MTLAFIRHGQTDWNATERLQGSSDIPLNDTGRQQAREVMTALDATEWDVIVSSPLSRARETAQIIAAGLGIELGRSYELLVERDYGQAEGITDEDALRRWPDHRYPGLETLDSVVARGIAALQQVTAENPARNVVIVCHGTIIRYTLAALAGRAFDQIVNGSVSTLDRVNGRWQVLSVNGQALDPVG